MSIRSIVTTTPLCVAIIATGLTTASAAGSSADRPEPTLGHSPQIVRTAQAAADDPCGYTAAIPADKFKGIPTYNAQAAARPSVGINPNQ